MLRFCRVLLRGGALTALLTVGLAAQATPEADPGTLDRVARFLAERGLATGALTPSDTASRDDAGTAPPGLIDRMRSTAGDLVLSAMNFLGVPYRWGGESEAEGFDCSGFTRHVFALALGLVLPRRSQEQAAASQLVDVPKDDLKPGDLVFFNTLRQTFSHVGIYVGDGKFIHAPRTGSEVRIEDMRASYWARRYNGARRPAGHVS